MTDTARNPLSQELREILLQVARESIERGLEDGRPLAVRATDYPPKLGESRASFVTLDIDNQLRGCIGHLQAVTSLVEDVAENAFAAAFRDPRFSPLSAEEFPALKIHISVLTPAVPMSFSSEQDLLSQLQPGTDGLILEEGSTRGTFLPSVWDSLADPKDFLTHLKHKAGLPAIHWSPDIKVYRYETESFG